MKNSVNSINYTIVATSCAALIAITSIGASAWAGTKAFTVPANKTTEIWYQTAFTEATCTAIDIRDYKLIQPKNGKLSVAKKRFKIPNGKCKGRTMNTLHISYTPKAGFHGQDQGGFKFRYDTFQGSTSKRTNNTTFKITVK